MIARTRLLLASKSLGMTAKTIFCSDVELPLNEAQKTPVPGATVPGCSWPKKFTLMLPHWSNLSSKRLNSVESKRMKNL